MSNPKIHSRFSLTILPQQYQNLLYLQTWLALVSYNQPTLSVVQPLPTTNTQPTITISGQQQISAQKEQPTEQTTLTGQQPTGRTAQTGQTETTVGQPNTDRGRSKQRKSRSKRSTSADSSSRSHSPPPPRLQLFYGDPTSLSWSFFIIKFDQIAKRKAWSDERNN